MLPRIILALATLWAAVAWGQENASAPPKPDPEVREEERGVLARLDRA